MKHAGSATNGPQLYTAPLSRREVTLLAGWERARQVVLTIDDLREAVGADAAQDVAWRLVRKKALARVGRGRYLVRPLRTLNHPTTPSAPVLAAALLQGERYYLGGLWALTFHRLSPQQYTSTLDAFVMRPHANRRLVAARLAFHRARSERFAYGLTAEAVEGVRVSLSDPARTILDLLDVPTLAGSSDEGLRLAKLALSNVSPRDLIDYGARGSRSSTCQRLGVLLERAGTSRRALAPLLERVAATKSVLSMRQGFRRAGRLNPRWRVVENDA